MLINTYKEAHYNALDGQTCYRCVRSISQTHYSPDKNEIMKFQFLFIISSIIFSDCFSQNNTVKKKDYETIFDEGIYVEKFDSTNISENRFTANNQIYLEGNKLTYDYYYENRDGKRYKFQELKGAGDLDFNEKGKAWVFVPIDCLSENTIDKLILTVKYGLKPMINNDPDYNQTVISYEYPQISGKETFSSSTGLIENEKNIWVHPPRDKFFRILEINPFPYIQAPYEIGNKWNWSLKIGSFWGDSRWKTWDESIENTYLYEIKEKKKIKLAIGEVECYVIQSTANSSIGQTHLTAYFSMNMGFVKLDYTNIDSTKTVLELIKFDKMKNDE